MIVFLTLIYVAILFLAVKIGLIKLNTFWKISPVIWMVLLFFVLFVPMQWGAPAGALNQCQTVIEIIPNVNGEVSEVDVVPLEMVKNGDVLFKLDPTQYQSKVNPSDNPVIVLVAVTFVCLNPLYCLVYSSSHEVLLFVKKLILAISPSSVAVQLSVTEDEYYVITVENDFDPEAISRKGEGIGLKNIQNRLTLMYNQNNLLTTQVNENIFLVKIYIPHEVEN